MSTEQNNETWRPGERLDEVPTQPYDPATPKPEPLNPDPGHAPDPFPIPPGTEPQSPAPVREPETPMPMTDPPGQEPPRLA